MSLSQQFLDKEDKWSNNVYMGDYSELRVKIFKYINEYFLNEQKTSLITEDILDLVDKDKQKKEKE